MRKTLLFIGVLVFLLSLLFFYLNRTSIYPYLTFSDGAKFADVGRNLLSGSGYGATFVRFGGELQINNKGLFSAALIPPLTPFINAAAFKLFGVSDFVVISVSAISFLILIFAVYLLGSKVWGKTVGFLSGLAVASSISFLGYAVSGATEPLFAVEIIFAIYFFTLKKKWYDILGFILFILMYLTNPHAPLYIVPILFYFLQIKTCDYKKSLKIFSLTLLAVVLLIGISLFIPGLSFGRILLQRVVVSLASNSTFAPANDILRMSQNVLGPLLVSNIIPIFKKAFYNLYNSYKLIPNIFSPYLVALFIISLFHWSRSETEKVLKITIIAMVLIVFLVNALTIPLYRYLHPLMPLVYLFAVAELVRIVRKVVDDWLLVVSGKLNTQITKHKSLITALISAFLVFFFVVGQSLGYIFLDSRFTNKTVNKNQPPVYVELSKILRDNTKPSDIVVTNLDTWGSWYGERRTIWYPLEPIQLSELDPQKVPVDAIYLTSYLMDDENYYMGAEWRQAFFNPNKVEDKFISQNYELKGIYSVKPEEDYERQEARAVLWVKKSQNSKL